MYIPMLLPFISLVIGIVSVAYGMNIWGGALIIFLGSSVYFYLASIRENPIKTFHYSPLHYLWIFLWFLGIGVIDTSLSHPKLLSEEELSEIVAVEGRVKEIRNSTFGDVIDAEIMQLIMKDGDVSTVNNTFIRVQSDATDLRIGDNIVFSGKNIKEITDSEYTFKSGYADALKRKGIIYRTNIPAKGIIKTGHTFSISEIANDIRDKIVMQIEKLNLSAPTKHFIITILTGDKNYLDRDTRDMFSNAGIAHILALSGMHVGIIAGIFLCLLFPLNFIGKYKLRFFLTALLLWGYAFITGMAPSIVRACIMTSAFIIAMILERKNTTLNSLCLAGFIILLFTPSALFDIGFQLSFLCVASLILFTEKLNPISRRFHPKLFYVCGLIIATLVATFTSWIVVAYYFKIFPTMFLPANILFLPILPFYISFILLYILFASCGIEIGWAGELIDRIYFLSTDLISSIGRDSVINLNIPSVSLWLWLIGVVVLGLALYKYHRKFTYPTAISLFAASILIIILNSGNEKKGLIICNTYPSLKIIYSDGFQEVELPSSDNALSFHIAGDKKIGILDIPHLKEDMKPIEDDLDYLIITGKYKDNLVLAVEKLKPEKIITHASLRKKKENKFRVEADSLRIPFHSLREKKSLKIYL